jgi:glucan-binding YG repeat protein
MGLVFDADGAVRFYRNGIAVRAGLVRDSAGNYYYINSTLKAVKGCTYAIGAANTNGLLPAGTYTFDAEGKMMNPPAEEPEVPVVKEGLVKDDDGEIRFYKNGVAIKAGLVQDAEGNYYYINSTLKAVKNCSYAFSTAMGNGLLPGGTYQFDAEGKLIQ